MTSNYFNEIARSAGFFNSDRPFRSTAFRGGDFLSPNPSTASRVEQHMFFKGYNKIKKLQAIPVEERPSSSNLAYSPPLEQSLGAEQALEQEVVEPEATMAETAGETVAEEAGLATAEAVGAMADVADPLFVLNQVAGQALSTGIESSEFAKESQDLQNISQSGKDFSSYKYAQVRAQDEREIRKNSMANTIGSFFGPVGVAIANIAAPPVSQTPKVYIDSEQGKIAI